MIHDLWTNEDLESEKNSLCFDSDGDFMMEYQRESGDGYSASYSSVTKPEAKALAEALLEWAGSEKCKEEGRDG